MANAIYRVPKDRGDWVAYVYVKLKASSSAASRSSLMLASI